MSKLDPKAKVCDKPSPNAKPSKKDIKDKKPEKKDNKKKPGKSADASVLINTLTKLAVDNAEVYSDIISEIKNKIASGQSFRGWNPTKLNLLLAELGEAQVKIATDRELWSDSPVAQRGSPEEGAFAMPEETEPSDPFDKVPPGIDSDIFFKIERAIESAERDIKEMKFSWEKYKTNPRKYEPQLKNLKYAANNIIKVLKHLVVDKISTNDNNSADEEQLKMANGFPWVANNVVVSEIAARTADNQADYETDLDLFRQEAVFKGIEVKPLSPSEEAAFQAAAAASHTAADALRSSAKAWSRLSNEQEIENVRAIYDPNNIWNKMTARGSVKIVKKTAADEGPNEKRRSYNYGECPDEVITQACKEQCPDGFPMTIRSKDEWRALAEAWNQGIDSHLEGMARSTADNTTGNVVVHPDELCTLLRRLNNSDNEESSDLRSSILQSLGIEEI